MAANTFTAQYGGDCEDCPHRIEPGDEVTYLSGGVLVHAVCGPDVNPAGEVCTRCYLELPASGVCGMCE